jgi:hypothetical protein
MVSVTIGPHFYVAARPDATDVPRFLLLRATWPVGTDACHDFSNMLYPFRSHFLAARMGHFVANAIGVKSREKRRYANVTLIQ